MTENITYQHKLIEKLPLSGFLAGGKPAGREGFEVIVMQQKGTGWHYYCTLAPGDTLQLSEQLFGSFYAYIVDTRVARLLEISDQFPTSNPLIKVKVTAKVLYRVINARRAAIEVEDPLGKFRDRIIGVLRREISQHPHQKVSEADCEAIIRRVGAMQPLGLAVEGVDLITMDQDSQVLRGYEVRAKLDYDRGLGQEVADEAHQQALRRQRQHQQLNQSKLEAELDQDRRKRQHNISMQREAIDSINLLNLNELMHMRPELAQDIYNRLTVQELSLLQDRLNHDNAFREQMLKVIGEYVKNNQDAPPEEVLRMIREAAAQSSSIGARISFGVSTTVPATPSNSPPIVFGRVIEGQVVQPSPLSPQDDDE